MDEPTTGVILRTRLLTESSLIVHWLTSDAGRIATVARGALRPKSAFRGKLDLFYRARFCFRRSRRSDLHTLTEVVLLQTMPSLREEWSRLTQAAYGVRFIEQTTECETPLPGIAGQFQGFLEQVALAPVSPVAVLAFELRLLAELGLAPDLESPTFPEKGRELAGILTGSDWARFASLEPAEDELRSLNRFLHGFLIDHLGQPPRGRAEALASLALSRGESEVRGAD